MRYFGGGRILVVEVICAVGSSGILGWGGQWRFIAQNLGISHHPYLYIIFILNKLSLYYLYTKLSYLYIIFILDVFIFILSLYLTFLSLYYLYIIFILDIFIFILSLYWTFLSLYYLYTWHFYLYIIFILISHYTIFIFILYKIILQLYTNYLCSKFS